MMNIRTRTDLSEQEDCVNKYRKSKKKSVTTSFTNLKKKG